MTASCVSSVFLLVPINVREQRQLTLTALALETVVALVRLPPGWGTFVNIENKRESQPVSRTFVELSPVFQELSVLAEES
jgi:hypothetical protein